MPSSQERFLSPLGCKKLFLPALNHLRCSVSSVYITRLSKFLPNSPVSNEQMESVLGMVDGRPSRARALVLRNNGIKTRYYALQDGKSTHSNASMAAAAVRGLFDEKFPISQLELLSAGTATPDQLVPSQASMVHGELGIQPVELLSASGSCCCSMQALKYAWMSVATGSVHAAVAVGSERVSTWLQADRFNAEADNLSQLEGNPYIAFEKDFLRWMLSDGAAALLLRDRPAAEGLSLRIDWLETTSFAGELEACMYAGAVKNEDGSLTGWSDLSDGDGAAQSVFSLKQDTRLLGDNIVELGGRYLKQLMEKHGFSGGQIDYFLPHMSSEFFKKKTHEVQQAIGLNIPLERWFYNLAEVGNVGSASAFLMLEELMRSRPLEKGQRILMMVPESARFSYAYMHLTVV